MTDWQSPFVVAAQGTSTLRNMGIIGRGYEDFVGKLQAVGAKVRA
jgi:UDP-N-acetylglucosamine enolpyruvyl transferase